ncbi:hypothetical protein BGX27_003693 [Mortierella sp. AM989]|nr:hypothetical protein BGX27_003693 [Mortierella sp. AM989]
MSRKDQVEWLNQTDDISITTFSTRFNYIDCDQAYTDFEWLIQNCHLKASVKSRLLHDFESWKANTGNVDVFWLEQEKDIEDWEHLAGRPRLAARLLMETVQSERKFGGSITKQSILETAVKNTLTAVGEKLTERLNTLAAEFIDSRDPQKRLMQDALFFGGSSRLGKLDDNWTRLVDCDVAFLTTTPDGMFVHVEELLAIRTVNLVLGLKYTRPTETLIRSLFKKLTASTLAQDTSKGKAWEYLVLAALLSYNGTMVTEFVRKFYSDPRIVLPQWTSQAVLNVESYGDADMFTLQSGFSHEDDIDAIDKLLDDANSRTYILQPANIMRPDGLYIGRLYNQPARQYWTLLFSAKFYNTPMSTQKTIDEDRASTDWSLAYHTKKGKVKATNLVTKLQGLQGYSAHRGSLRIHFVLPGLAASKDGSPRGGIQVEDNDVLMYIDRSMLEELFQLIPNIAEDLNELLEK